MTSLPRPTTRRSLSRWIHLVAGALIGTFIYAPAHVGEPLRLLLQTVVIPAIVITGIYLWKRAAIHRRLRALRRRARD
ncbi:MULTISPECIES: hypothetical protein [Microbacterium]|uniref:hypothetical protein n=1 Tax=Microbacterium TaxID=33882 RepID=UPI00277DB958|nr:MULTISPECIES: hypothetical protein [Microbacterium]MDQ1083342.1 hypothetical protein [Microbacterium sp. SORGH_AS_0344]MDQ1171378.1 hypothetical protein [Microbacterium proteolyticum]